MSEGGRYWTALLECAEKKLFSVAMKILYFHRRVSNKATGKNTQTQRSALFQPVADETVIQASFLSRRSRLEKPDSFERRRLRGAGSSTATQRGQRTSPRLRAIYTTSTQTTTKATKS